VRPPTSRCCARCAHIRCLSRSHAARAGRRSGSAWETPAGAHRRRRPRVTWGPKGSLGEALRAARIHASQAARPGSTRPRLNRSAGDRRCSYERGASRSQQTALPMTTSARIDWAALARCAAGTRPRLTCAAPAAACGRLQRARGRRWSGCGRSCRRARSCTRRPARARGPLRANSPERFRGSVPSRRSQPLTPHRRSVDHQAVQTADPHRCGAADRWIRTKRCLRGAGSERCRGCRCVLRSVPISYRGLQPPANQKAGPQDEHPRHHPQGALPAAWLPTDPPGRVLAAAALGSARRRPSRRSSPRSRSRDAGAASAPPPHRATARLRSLARRRGSSPRRPPGRWPAAGPPARACSRRAAADVRSFSGGGPRSPLLHRKTPAN